MNIPTTFYIRFWLKNSLMAMATGFALGYMLMSIIPIILPPVTVSIFAFSIYQIALTRHLWGKDRGNFEYAYRERLTEKAANSIIIKTIGFREFVRLYLDELSTMGIVREELYKEVLATNEISLKDELKFYIYVKAAKSALKESNFEKELSYLKQAVSINPDDLVANYRLGSSLERAGNGSEAISSYEAALSDPLISTRELREFISIQIRRVEARGPAKKPPMPGLRYMAW